MKKITAIGFDLFNTLIEADKDALMNAMDRLICSLQEKGLADDGEAFSNAYSEAAISHIKKSCETGIETHNRFWISEALARVCSPVPPDDVRIAEAIEDYFSMFYPGCRLIPGAADMLAHLKGEYRLGLLSNFTHAPAAITLIERLNLAPFFKTVVISGAVGYRKPHPVVFDHLVAGLKVERKEILFIGDDVEADIKGAAASGLQPLWITYAIERNRPFTDGKYLLDAHKPDEHVPRISKWEELKRILK